MVKWRKGKTDGNDTKAKGHLGHSLMKRKAILRGAGPLNWISHEGHLGIEWVALCNCKDRTLPVGEWDFNPQGTSSRG